MASLSSLFQLSIARSTLASGLVSLFLESLFFGAFAVVYGITAWILLIRDRHQGRSNWDLMLFIASTVMFVFALVVRAFYIQYLKGN